MDDIKWLFKPQWSELMTRKDYIFNTLSLWFFWIIGSIFSLLFFSLGSDLITGVILLLMLAGGIYSTVLSICWANSRLRDSGLESEGWRLAILIAGFCITVIGFGLFVYLCFKSSEKITDDTIEV